MYTCVCVCVWRCACTYSLLSARIYKFEPLCLTFFISLPLPLPPSFPPSPSLSLELPTSKYSKTNVFESDCCCYCVCVFGCVCVTAYVCRLEDSFVYLISSLYLCMNSWYWTEVTRLAWQPLYMLSHLGLFYRTTYSPSYAVCFAKHSWEMTSWTSHDSLSFRGSFLQEYSGICRLHLHIQKTMERDPFVICGAQETFVYGVVHFISGPHSDTWGIVWLS